MTENGQVNRCKIADCENIAGLPGTAHGWCRTHYQRWYRHGSPDAPLPKRNCRTSTCSDPGCDEPSVPNGLCVNHQAVAQRQKDNGRYGSLTPEQRNEALERAKTWRRDNRDRYRAAMRRSHLKQRYGISLEAYELLYSAQSGVCAVCKRSQAALDVDHDHDTDEIRGLLCHRCNWALGILGDDPKLLRSAAKYFEYFARNIGRKNR